MGIAHRRLYVFVTLDKDNLVNTETHFKKPNRSKFESMINLN